MCCIILSWFLTSAGYETISAWTGLANMYLVMSDCHLHERTFLGAAHCRPSLHLKRSERYGCERDQPQIFPNNCCKVLQLGRDFSPPFQFFISSRSLAIQCVSFVLRYLHSEQSFVRGRQAFARFDLDSRSSKDLSHSKALARTGNPSTSLPGAIVSTCRASR